MNDDCWTKKCSMNDHENSTNKNSDSIISRLTWLKHKININDQDVIWEIERDHAWSRSK
jgi:hypothetical protein